MRRQRGEATSCCRPQQSDAGNFISACLGTAPSSSVGSRKRANVKSGPPGPEVCLPIYPRDRTPGWSGMLKRAHAKPLDSANAMTRESRVLHCQTCQRNFTICYVVVDPFSKQILSGLICLHRLDRSIFRQLGDDIVALSVCVRIGGVGDLKCQSSERQAGVSCAGPDPKNALNLRWPVGVEPETRGIPKCPGHASGSTPKIVCDGASADCYQWPSENRCPGRVRKDRAC